MEKCSETRKNAKVKCFRTGRTKSPAFIPLPNDENGSYGFLTYALIKWTNIREVTIFDISLRSCTNLFDIAATRPIFFGRFKARVSRYIRRGDVII